jgi:hypothetical protein
MSGSGTAPYEHAKETSIDRDSVEGYGKSKEDALHRSSGKTLDRDSIEGYGKSKEDAPPSPTEALLGREIKRPKRVVKKGSGNSSRLHFHMNMFQGIFGQTGLRVAHRAQCNHSASR